MRVLVPVAVALVALAAAPAGASADAGPTPAPSPTPPAAAASPTPSPAPTPPPDPSPAAPPSATPNAKPPLALDLPAGARAGAPVTLTVTAGAAPAAAAVRWTLGQAGRERTLTSATGRLRLTDLEAGGVLVRAIVGTTSLTGAFTVAAAPHTAPPPRVRTVASARPVARAASGLSVAIQDFDFAPKSITVDVGGAVTWTNHGHQPHTATATDGSFDTGTLNTGQSASHTFTKAGTFSYFCTVHPFMKGTVVVRAASAPAAGQKASGSGAGSTGTGDTSSHGATAAGTSAGSAPATTTASAAPARPSLPNTGDDALLRLALGAALVALGAGARRATRRPA